MGLDKLDFYLKNKWLILDTNFLMYAQNKVEIFDIFLKKIKELKCQLVSCAFIRAEFLRSEPNNNLYQQKLDFLNELSVDDLPLNSFANIIDGVISKGRDLRRKKYPVPGFVDACLMELVCMYASNLYIATFNHKDFAYGLKRVAILPFEFSKEDVKVLGIYSAL
jgi:hypothetical protein